MHAFEGLASCGPFFWSSLELKQTWTWHVFQRCPFLIVKQCPSIWSAKRWEHASRLCFLNYYIFIFVCKGCCTNMWQQHQFSGQPIGASAYHCQSAYIDPTWRILQPPVQMEDPLLETSLSDSFCSLAHHVCDWRLTMKPGMGLKNTLAKAGLATRQSTNFCDANVTLCPTGGGDLGLRSFISKDCCMDQRISVFFSGWVSMDQNAFAVNDEQHRIFWVNQWTCFPFLKLCDFENVEKRNIYNSMTLLICLWSICLLSRIFLLLKVDVVHFLKQPVVFTTFGRINGRFPIHSKVVSHKTIGRLRDIFFNQHFQVVVQCTFLLFIGTWDIPFCFFFQHPGRVVFCCWRLPIFVAVDLSGSHSMVGVIASAYPISQFFGSAPVGVVKLDVYHDSMLVRFSPI